MANFKAFYNEAKYIFKDRIFNDYARCYAYGIDASCYFYIPKIVIIAKNEDEIKQIIQLANTYKIPITFRAAGTSLSGQSSCDGVLVVIKFAFKKIKINKDASEITLGCGVVGIHANESLAFLKKKIGPDPATINSALIGGIINNNSSGMCCGTKDNSYKTLRSIRVILANGSMLDTSDALSVARFKDENKKLINELREIKEEINANKELKDLIIKKFKIKNTTGYSLNAFVDYDDEIDILAHLLVGSEGTLGFVSEVKLAVLDDLEFKACALLFFDNINNAANTIKEFAKVDFISSAEIMDYASLKAASNYDELRDILADIKEGNTCVLIQSEHSNELKLDENINKIKEISKLAYKSYFSKNKAEYDLWWKIRKALLPIAASLRKAGSTVITEDVCFNIEDLADGIKSIQELFYKYGFSDNGIIFGHALAGNIHFIITPDLNNKLEFDNFSNLVKEMSNIVASYGGSIKAEHGTGRMVAPFVEVEWGKQAYLINKKIKSIFDKDNLFNPDVIISDDKDIYKKNIKQASWIDEKLNTCMECGFCERFCPSNEYTITPRQRIAILREIKRLESLNDDESKAKLKDIKKYYNHLVDSSCAACGVCSFSCPLGINFADFSLKYRKNNIGFISKILGNLAYKNHEKTLKIAKFSLSIANKFDNLSLDNKLEKASNFLSIIPRTRAYLPKVNDYELKSRKRACNVVYFTSCLNKSFKPNEKMHDKRSLQEVFESLCKKANIGIIYAPNDLCCGKAYENFQDIQDKNIQKINDFLSNIDSPIVLDHSACSAKLISDHSKYEIYDLSEYLLKFIAPKLRIDKINENVGLYIMCAARKLGLNENIIKLAKLCTNGKVLIDNDTYCCGFAGCKGFFKPQLNINATKGFKKFYAKTNIKRGFSTSSTCEIGLSDATGISWQHIAYLLDECSEKQFN
ncbi:FAD-binding oxidoreductase [Campylobacter coli]|nr:FAD-binding oxidoreductase [Campylobacter coli]